MKRNSFFLAALAVLAVSAVSCGGGSDGNTLNVFNWSVYTPTSVIEKFEKEYGVQVRVTEYASNEEMYAALTSGGSSGYDIVYPSQDYVSIMMSQGMFEKIDKSLLPNLKNLDPAVLKQITYDPDMDYSVPYYWGAAGILVNTGKVPDFDKSWGWDIFSRSELADRMTMLDDMREVMGDALRHLGYSVNSKNAAEIEEAKNLINNEWKPNLTKFDSGAVGRDYANGEFWVVQGYAELVYEEIADNQQLIEDTVFFIPSTGGPAYIDSMCILKGSEKIELAHKFIDFIHRPEIYAEFCDFFGFPSAVNTPARQYLKGPTWYKPEDFAHTELKFDLGEALELYNDAWDKSIRIGN